MGTFHGKSYRHFAQHHKTRLDVLGPLTGPDIAKYRRVAAQRESVQDALRLLLRRGM